MAAAGRCASRCRATAWPHGSLSPVGTTLATRHASAATELFRALKRFEDEAGLTPEDACRARRSEPLGVPDAPVRTAAGGSLRPGAQAGSGEKVARWELRGLDLRVKRGLLWSD